MNFRNLDGEELARYLQENPNEEFLEYFVNNIIYRGEDWVNIVVENATGNLTNRQTHILLGTILKIDNMNLIDWVKEHTPDFDTNKEFVDIVHPLALLQNFHQLEILLEKGINLPEKQSTKNEILGYVLSTCDLDLVKFLFDNGATLDHEAPIFNCISDNCFNIVKYIVEEQHIQIPKKALAYSVKGQYQNLTEYLLRLLYPEINMTATQLFQTIGYTNSMTIREINSRITDILEPSRRARALKEITANEEKRAQAIQEYKTREEKSPESGVQKVCSSSSQNSFLTGDELKDDDKIVIFFFEDNRVGAEDALKGECYLVEELEMAYKSYLEESEEPDGSLKIPVCEWQGPPAPYGKNFRPYGRDPTKPVFRLPYSGAWVTGRTIEEVLEDASKKDIEFPIIVNLMGRKTSIGSYFGVSQLHGQWGGDWAKSTDEKGNTIAVMPDYPGPDEREIVYEKWILITC